MERGLAGALLEGYRVLTEGSGEVGAARYVYDNLVEPVRRLLCSKEVQSGIYRVVCGKQDGLNLEIPSPENGGLSGWHVVFGRGTGTPRYYPEKKTISIPVTPFLRPVPGAKDKDGTAEIDPVMSANGTLMDRPDRFLKCLFRSWGFHGKNAAGTICLRDTLLHEGLHLYDDLFNPGMHPGKSRPDLTGADRKAAAAMGSADRDVSRTASSAELSRDAAFPPWYRSAKFYKDDVKSMSDFRRSFPQKDVDAYNVAGRVKPYTRTPAQSDDFSRMEKPHNKYMYWNLTHSNMETRAYLMEQLPSLLMNKRHGHPYDPKEIVPRIVEHAFSVPEPSGKPATHGEYADSVSAANDRDAWRNRVKESILPGAKKSVARRAWQLVSAINAIDPPDDMGLNERMALLDRYMKSQRGRTEAAGIAGNALLEGKGMVCRIIDGARDALVRRGMDKELANRTVLLTRKMFFDPFASPGANPVTDPEFKRMLPMFGYLVHMMVDVYLFGTPRYDREAAENFAARFVEYARTNFRDGLPNIGSLSEFERLAEEIDGNGSLFRPSAEDYTAIPVESWEELKELSGKYRLGAWCNVDSRSDWDRYSLYGSGRFYLLVRDGTDGSTVDKRAVIGIVVNQYGKVVYAFDRENDVVDKTAVQALASELGLDSPEASGFGDAIDLLNGGYGNPEEIYPFCEEVWDSVYIVGEFPKDRGDRYAMLCRVGDRYEYTGRTFDDYARVSGFDGLLVIDGRELYSLASGGTIFRVPGDLTIRGKATALDREGMMIPVFRGDTVVNCLCPDDRNPKLLLDAGNDVPVDSVEFHTKSRGKSETVERMSPGDYWVVVTASGDSFIVTSAGAKLEGEPGIPAGDSGMTTFSLSDNGYYAAKVQRTAGEPVQWFLMRNGKNVFDKPFAEIYRDSEDDYRIDLVNSDGTMYIFDPYTEKLEKMP